MAKGAILKILSQKDSETELYRSQSKFPRPEPLFARPICKKHFAERRTRFAQTVGRSAHKANGHSQSGSKASST